MQVEIKHDTAARCARRLIAALQSGSSQRVGSALERIAILGSCKDTRELEFRDLLAGIAQPAPMSGVALRMLAHVAAAAS